MAPSFDYAVSSLLCAEDNTSIIFDEVENNDINYNEEYEIVDSNWENGNHLYNNNNDNNKDWNFIIGIDETQILTGFFVPSDECLATLFEKERQYFLGIDYLKRLKGGDFDLLARNLAIDWIFKVQSHYSFGPLCAYLSVNYLDRFLAAYELPKSNTWMMQLLAVACLSLAAKVDETDVPLCLDLQVGESKFVFEAKTIQRMELLVLSTLKWRMQSVTPFSFIHYFLYKLSGDARPPKTLVFQAIQLILSTIKGIDLHEFRASEIAAAVAFSVTQETQIVELTDKAFSFLTDQVEKERLVRCVETLQDMRTINRCNGSSGFGVSTSMPQSPIGVLDVGCLSYKSDETLTPSGSCANSAQNSPAQAPKRMKLDRSTGPSS